MFLFSIPSILRAIYAQSILPTIFQIVIFSRKLQSNESRNTLVSTKFPFSVQDSCSKSRGKEKYLLEASQKPRDIQLGYGFQVSAAGEKE